MDTHGSIPEPAEAIKTPPTPEPPASTHAGATGRGMAVKVPRRNNGELLRYPPALRGAYGPRGLPCPRARDCSARNSFRRSERRAPLHPVCAQSDPTCSPTVRHGAVDVAARGQAGEAKPSP